jgi:5'-nucleotidase
VKPLILISNDDGINATGLRVLRDSVAHLGNVLVVAPEHQCSAASHAVSIFKEMPYRVVLKNGQPWGHALEGMPSDCVKLGVLTLADRKPDLVLSGINPGANIGNNILYSGTVAAAREGAMLGIPSIAVSLNFFRHTEKERHFETAGEWAARLSEMVLRRGLPRGVVLNLNVPNLPSSEIRGAVISRQSRSMFQDEMEPAQENGEVRSYRNVGKIMIEEPEADEDNDDVVLKHNKVSITPLHYDLTEHHFREELAAWIKEHGRKS